MNNVLKAKKEIMKKQDNAVYYIVEKNLETIIRIFSFYYSSI